MIYRHPNVDGAMGETELQQLFKWAREAKAIVEVGSHKGRSTHALLSGCRGTVWAVDKWRGKKTNHRYLAFKKNVGHFPHLKIMRMWSLEAAPKFADNSLCMVFIDADHRYVPFRADLLAWGPKVKPGGRLCGHDYCEQWPGVVQAVDELLPGRLIVPETTLWHVVKEA
jgi:predicted O-methyltransferase YrrM